MKWIILVLLALLVLLFIRWAFLPHSRLPRFRVGYTRLRLHLRLHPGRGFATVGELWLRWGRWASFRKSKRSRASLGFWRRALHPAQHSVFLGRAHYRHGLRLPVEEHALIVAPPRTYKSAFLARAIQHYPGPVVSTTTKADVFKLTAGIRSRTGPVYVFNPEGVGGIPSTIRWNPVAGCEEPATAIRRADGFANGVSTEGTQDAQFWSSKASGYLRALMQAAALVGGSMPLVAAWGLSNASYAEGVLEGQGAEQAQAELAELRGPAEKTTATVRMVMSRALQFLADPALAQCVLPVPGEDFNIRRFLAERGTLYMIADSKNEESPVAPLFACLASEIHHQAELIGQSSPGGRLDPPLLMALDEITQTCPVPLPTWAADSGGKGIQIISVVHGEAQLTKRWKETGKQVIIDTASAILLLPGIKDTKTLKMASDLCGQSALREVRADQHARHPVMSEDMIRALPPGFGLVIRGGLSPVIARLPRAWRSLAYRRHGRSVPVLRPAPVAAVSSLPRPAVAPVADLELEPVGDAVTTPRSEPRSELADTYPWSAR
jgi:type IV secretion system protein VirD4